MAKIEQGTALLINESGAMKKVVFDILGRKDGKIKIKFPTNEVLILDEKNIRGRRVVIFRTSTGKLIVQNPDKWKTINLKEYGIKDLRFNLQNFGLQEGKSAIHRWTLPPDKIAKLAPLIKLLFICIVVGVIGWSAMKFGTYALDLVMKSRVLDCSQVIPRVLETPIGAITNSTPIGVN